MDNEALDPVVSRLGELFSKELMMSLLKSTHVKSALVKATLVVTCIAGLSACAPEVGSEAWCKKMQEKPKGDWTANEMGDYAKHCVFK